MTANALFRKFIIITMILTVRHDALASAPSASRPAGVALSLDDEVDLDASPKR